MSHYTLCALCVEYIEYCVFCVWSCLSISLCCCCCCVCRHTTTTHENDDDAYNRKSHAVFHSHNRQRAPARALLSALTMSFLCLLNFIRIVSVFSGIHFALCAVCAVYTPQHFSLSHVRHSYTQHRQYIAKQCSHMVRIALYWLWGSSRMNTALLIPIEHIYLHVHVACS